MSYSTVLISCSFKPFLPYLTIDDKEFSVEIIFIKMSYYKSKI